MIRSYTRARRPTVRVATTQEGGRAQPENSWSYLAVAARSPVYLRGKARRRKSLRRREVGRARAGRAVILINN